MHNPVHNDARDYPHYSGYWPAGYRNDYGSSVSLYRRRAVLMTALFLGIEFAAQRQPVSHMSPIPHGSVTVASTSHEQCEDGRPDVVYSQNSCGARRMLRSFVRSCKLHTVAAAIETDVSLSATVVIHALH